MKAKITNIKNKIKSNKKAFFQGLIGVVTLLVFVGGATYAFIKDRYLFDRSNPINATTATTDLLTFSFDNDNSLVITATPDNLGASDDSIVASTTATALLRANNSTNYASARYNIYFILDESNNYIYTTSDHKPELVFRVTDPNGNTVEHITGLTGSNGNFDVTTRTGGYLIAADYEIESSGEQVTQDWYFELEYVNLDTRQNANGGKTFTGTIYITQEQKPTYNPISVNSVVSSTTYHSISVNSVNYTEGTSLAKEYYYAVKKAEDTEELEFFKSEDGTYTFDGLDHATNYEVYAYIIDDKNIKSNVYSTTITTNNYNLPKINNVSLLSTEDSMRLKVIAEDGEGEIIKYYYSIDNGENFVETTSTTYTFDNLTDSTDYDVLIKVEDENHKFSNNYVRKMSTIYYVLPDISTVYVKANATSAILTPVGMEDSSNDIDHFEYSIDNGINWQPSNTFNYLNRNTAYTVLVRAVDTLGRKTATPYKAEFTTGSYELPKVLNVTAVGGQGQISITATADGGDNPVKYYKYSRDDGSNWVTIENPNTMDTYVFSGLTPSTVFYIKVVVVDTNGEESTPYQVRAKTLYPIEIATVLNGDSGKAPTVYGAQGVLNCNGVTGTYSNKFSNITISEVDGSYVNCTLEYTSPTNTENLVDYVIGLTDTNQGTGKVVHEVQDLYKYKKLTTSDAYNVSDTTFFIWDDSTKQYYISSMTSDEASITFTPTPGMYQICYSISFNYSYYDRGRVYINDEEVIYIDTADNDVCVYIGNISSTDEIKVTYKYGYSYSSSSNKMSFYLLRRNDTPSDSIDTGYRYEGANPNNYVWFNNELWRIIGVFDEATHGVNRHLVKIIRNEPIDTVAGSSYWGQSFSTSRYLLNNYYLTSSVIEGQSPCIRGGFTSGDRENYGICDYRNTGIKANYRKMIKKITWKAYFMTSVAKNSLEMYLFERGIKRDSSFNPDDYALYDDYIGLVYPSDFGFASLSSTCSRDYLLNDYLSSGCAGSNWIAQAGSEWTFVSSSHMTPIRIDYKGYLKTDQSVEYPNNIRPVLYLNENVYKISGTGTYTDPYIIGMK